MASKIRVRKEQNKLEKIAEEVEETVNSDHPIEKKKKVPIDAKFIVSTGSTLLDLAISGGRVRGGGIPGGLMMEISGPSSSGKTALLVEIGASVQFVGGTVTFADPEARLDKEYASIYGLELPKQNYSRPDTVTEMMDQIRHWDPDPECIHLFGADSLAQLSTELELSEAGDKRGQRKAKELSEGCRIVARKIASTHKIVCFTNQEKDGEYGKTTPGGKAVGFQSSIRLRVTRKQLIEKEKTNSYDKKIKKAIGILSEVYVFKNAVDSAFRKAPIYIIPNVGIDDVRANLQYVKDMTKCTMYSCIDKEYKEVDRSMLYIEKNNLEKELREKVIDLWEEIEEQFVLPRKKKQRF